MTKEESRTKGDSDWEDLHVLPDCYGFNKEVDSVLPLLLE